MTWHAVHEMTSDIVVHEATRVCAKLKDGIWREPLPVYSSHLTNYKELEVGRRMREARQKAGFTLRDLSRRAKTSAAQLSNIETGKAVMTFDSFSRLAGHSQYRRRRCPTAPSP